MKLNGLFCADLSLVNNSLIQSITHSPFRSIISIIFKTSTSHCQWKHHIQQLPVMYRYSLYGFSMYLRHYRTLTTKVFIAKAKKVVDDKCYASTHHKFTSVHVNKSTSVWRSTVNQIQQTVIIFRMTTVCLYQIH